MRKVILFFVLVISLSSCKEKTKQTESIVKTPVENEELIMYEMSEMALLMEKMFIENERLKKKIEDGESLGAFNKEYLNIHSAVLTDPSVRDASFNSF